MVAIAPAETGKKVAKITLTIHDKMQVFILLKRNLFINEKNFRKLLYPLNFIRWGECEKNFVKGIEF
jgi:hypothetical protein